MLRKVYAFIAHTLKALRIGGASTMRSQYETPYNPKRRNSNSYVDALAGLLFTKPYSVEYIDEVNEAAMSVGPINYELDLGDREELIYFSTGCQGDSVAWGTDPQKEVADQLLADIKRLPPELRPSFINFTGDNVASPGSFYDEAFKKHFYSLYVTEATAKIPSLMTTGNHDENIDIKSYHNPMSTSGYSVILYSIAQTYLNKTGNIAETKSLRNLFSGPKLNLEQLAEFYKRHFIFPNDFYGVHWKQFQLFSVNSNSIVKEFLLSCALDPESPHYQRNQFIFIDAEYKKAVEQDRTIVFSQHHPLRSSGKRVKNGDAHFYFRDVPDGLTVISKAIKAIDILEYHRVQPETIRHLIVTIIRKIYTNPNNLSRISEQFRKVIAKHLVNAHLIKKSDIDFVINGPLNNAPLIYNYGFILCKLYALVGWQTALIDVSHDHFANYFNNMDDPTESYKICQTTYGGSKLQSHEYFGEHPHVGYHNKRLGYKQIRWNPNNPKVLEITYRPIGEPEVEFTNLSKYPIRNKCCDAIEAIRTLILDMCDDYFSYLNKPTLQGNKIAINVVTELDKLINYLNQRQLPPLQMFEGDVRYLIDSIPDEAPLQKIKQPLIDALESMRPELTIPQDVPREEAGFILVCESAFKGKEPEEEEVSYRNGFY